MYHDCFLVLRFPVELADVAVGVEVDVMVVVAGAAGAAGA